MQIGHHAWDEDAAVADPPVAGDGARHSWEEPDSGSECNSDSSFEVDAEGEFLDLMLELLRNRTIPANIFCTLMHMLVK
jgi:hypothetical protein